jgi:hypothetical protein
MPYVYRHIRLDKNEPFYIGIGSDKNYQRAKESHSRNKHWVNISKNGFEVEILFDNLTWEQACEKEKEFISLYGRADLNTGILCNMTDGGEGAVNRIFTKEHREKIRQSKIGIKRSAETIEKMSIGRKGHKHTEEWKRNMSLRVKGEGNPNYGLPTPEYIKEMKRKIILDINTGVYYNSLEEACLILKINSNRLSKMLNGKKENKTPLKYV